TEPPREAAADMTPTSPARGRGRRAPRGGGGALARRRHPPSSDLRPPSPQKGTEVPLAGEGKASTRAPPLPPAGEVDAHRAAGEGRSCASRHPPSSGLRPPSPASG